MGEAFLFIFSKCKFQFQKNIHSKFAWNISRYFVQTFFLTNFFYRTTLEGIFDWLEKWYFPTHLRLGGWVIGIMLGYAIHQTDGKKVKINKFVDAALWVLSLSILLGIVLGHYPFIQMDNNPSRFSNAMYNTCFRVLWSYAVAWIIFACHNGTGGVIRWFLSLKEWQPLGKLGLSIYLVHNIYQVITTINQKQPIIWDFFTQTQKFYGDVLVSIFLGTILYLCVENPVLLIENYVYNKIKGSKWAEIFHMTHKKLPQVVKFVWSCKLDLQAFKLTF